MRQLAASLKALGYDVLIDADVEYGDGLNGFMRRATSCSHVLLVVDENYIDRADTVPESGVAFENRAIAEVFKSKHASWLLVIFKENPARRFPAWLADHNPKSLDFNAAPHLGRFPDSEQLEALWRWVEGLSANRDHATSVATLRNRAQRLEELERQRDPQTWASAAPAGELTFEYDKAPGNSYRLGNAQYAFQFEVTGRGANSVYVYSDKIQAVGINRSGATTHDELAAQLTPGRSVGPAVGDQVVLLNREGAMCLVDILEVQREVTNPSYVPASLRFRYRILMDS